MRTFRSLILFYFQLPSDNFLFHITRHAFYKAERVETRGFETRHIKGKQRKGILNLNRGEQELYDELYLKVIKKKTTSERVFLYRVEF